MTRPSTPAGIAILPVTGIGEVRPGDDVAALIAAAAADDPGIRDGDVLVVSSKVVAKAAGRTAAPREDETPDQARRRLALELADEVLVDTPFVVVVRTAHGFVCANAGIDASNTPGGDVLLLPVDPDADAAALRTALAAGLPAGADVGVIVSDTFGRAWREGQTDVALGVAGIPAVRDERGRTDREGRPLSVTLIALADQLAGAADLVRDKAAGVPAVIIRGTGLVGGPDPAGTGADLVRDRTADLFPRGRGWLARHLATGEGRPVRVGQPTAAEWDQVRAAAARAADVSPAAVVLAGAAHGGRALLVTDGVAAGVALACLIDLGHAGSLDRTADGWAVAVRTATSGP